MALIWTHTIQANFKRRRQNLPQK